MSLPDEDVSCKGKRTAHQLAVAIDAHAGNDVNGFGSLSSHS